MLALKQIESAIEGLPPEDLHRLAEWFETRVQSRWDIALERDAESGRLDALYAELTEEGESGVALDEFLRNEEL